MAESLSRKRTAIYARYSSDRQKDASIEDQARRCEEVIERLGGAPAEAVLYADRALSGTSRHRPGLESLLRAVESGELDVIVVEDVSRLSRDLADAAEIFKTLEYHQVSLLGVDGIDTSQRGAKVNYTIKSLFADMFVDELREKTLRGLEGQFLENYSTGNTPYGYKSEAVKDSRGKHLGYLVQVLDEEAQVVRQIFVWYRDGQSLSAIARKLNQQGTKSPREGTQHRHKGWGASTVRAMLRNKKYSGEWRYKETRWTRVPGSNKRRPQKRPEDQVMKAERPQLAIIAPDLWTAVHARIAAVARKYQRKPGSPGGPAYAGRRSSYLFSGLLACGECHGNMTVMGGASRAYYSCSIAKKKGLCRNHRNVREDVVRTSLLRALKDHLTSDAAIAHVRKRIALALGDLSRQASSELQERQDRLDRTETRIQGLVSFIADGDRSTYVVEALKDLEAQAKQEKASIRAIQRSASEPVRLPSIEEVMALVFDLEARFKEDIPGARELLRKLFKDGTIRLELDGENYVARSELLPLVLLVETEKRTTRNRLSDSASFSDGSGDKI